MNLPLLLLNRRRRGGTAFSPASLFASGEEGAWYEPSTTTCFTDTGGTTAATYGDGVAYLEDLSGNGNHATQVTAGARPILARVPEGGRRNLLTYTEQFDNAVWNKTNSSISANTSDTTDPLGTNTADKYSNTSAADFLNTASAVTISSGTNYAVSVFAKKGTQDWLRLSFFTTTNGGAACNGWFNLNTGQTGSVLSGTEGTGVSVNIVGEGNGWYRCTLVGRTTSAATLYPTITMVTADAVTTRPATGNELYIWGAQLETGSTATAYQKVVSEYDVTEAGVTSLDYLSFDGSDDTLNFTNTILGTAEHAALFGCKATGASSTIFSFGTESTAQRRSITNDILFGVNSANEAYGPAIDGVTFIGGSLFPAAGTKVEDHTCRVNGAERAATSSVSPTTVLNTTGSAAFLGSNLGAIYGEVDVFGFVLLDRDLTTQEISKTETYLAAKSGVTL